MVVVLDTRLLSSWVTGDFASSLSPSLQRGVRSGHRCVREVPATGVGRQALDAHVLPLPPLSEATASRMWGTFSEHDEGDVPL